MNDALHVFPLSFEYDSRTSDPDVPAPLVWTHCAASVPSASRITDGTSAQLTIQSSPDPTVVGSDHAAPLRSANFSQLRLSAGRRRR
jgi:hypothetical protein